MKKIAIIGSTGYIGKTLIDEFYKKNNTFELFLFSRSKEKLYNTIKINYPKLKNKIYNYKEFNKNKYDVIINCTGFYKSGLSNNEHNDILSLTEKYDNLIIKYIEKNKSTLYINFSSGAVYEKIDPKQMTEGSYYSIAKINSESKHRAKDNLKIVDLRMFSFFSKFIDCKSSFFMSEIIDCVKNKKIFYTTKTDIVRDYICPKDLFKIISIIIKNNNMNDFFDIYSLAPISKLNLLKFFEKEYGLKIIFKKTPSVNKKPVERINYYSVDRKIEKLGYKPKFTSLEGIKNELRIMNIHN